jgi:hypothetical protein
LGPASRQRTVPGRDPDRVPGAQLDDVVVELHPHAAADDDVDLLLRAVAVAERLAEAGRHAEVRQAGLLELERLAGEAGLEVRRQPGARREVLDLLEVDDRVRGVRHRDALRSR